VNTTSRAPSVAVIAARKVQQDCHAILMRAARRPPVLRSAQLANAGRLLHAYRPSAILLDAVTSPLEALFLLPTIKRLSPASHVILIGGKSTSTEFLLEAVRRGACGHLAARHLARYLSKAVLAVATGDPWLSRRLAAAIVADLRARSGPAHATTRLRLLRGRGERVTSSRRHRRLRRRSTAPSLTMGCHT
jgi:DNA-binding NarL/FixJ family response regulator